MALENRAMKDLIEKSCKAVREAIGRSVADREAYQATLDALQADILIGENSL